MNSERGRLPGTLNVREHKKRVRSGYCGISSDTEARRLRALTPWQESIAFDEAIGPIQPQLSQKNFKVLYLQGVSTRRGTLLKKKFPFSVVQM
jgi:hypothetical protein